MRANVRDMEVSFGSFGDMPTCDMSIEFTPETIHDDYLLQRLLYHGSAETFIKSVYGGGDNESHFPEIKKVIFNAPATIVYWSDGTKTVVKCQGNDNYDEHTGLALCIAKKAIGNKGNFNDILRKWIPEKKS